MSVLFATPSSDAFADQADEVDRTILDAMQKSYEPEKTEKAKEKPDVVQEPRPGAPATARPRTVPPGGFSPAKTAQLLKVCGSQDNHADAIRKAKALLDAGADSNGKEQSTGATPLIKAAEAGNTELVALLLDYGASIHASDNNGGTALDAAIGWPSSKDVKCIELLLKRGASPNAADRNGTTSLMGAVMNGEVKVISLLLEYGANPNASRSDGMTALLLAAFAGDADSVRLLLKQGASMQDGHGQPCLVLTSKSWILVAGNFPDMQGPYASLSVYDSMLTNEFKPSCAWVSFGGPLERLAGKLLLTETTQGWIIAEPADFLRRLQAGERLYLRIDSLDGQHASAEFSLTGTKPAISATLVAVERAQGWR